MTLGEAEIGALIVTLVRASGLVATAPVVGDHGIPVRVRLCLVLAITAAVGPSRPGVPFAELAPVAILELFVGVMTGLVARFIVGRLAVAGQLFGLSLGLGFAAQFDVHAGESAGTLRALVTAVAGLAFLAVGGLEAIVRGVASTPAEVSRVAELAPELVQRATDAFGHGLVLAAPVVLAALIANVGFALINRAAPASNVFSIALAGVLAAGGFVLLTGAGTFLAGVAAVVREAAAILGGG